MSKKQAKKTAKSSKKVVQYFIVKLINGREVKRTEINAKWRRDASGRFIGNLPKAAYRRVVTCPYCDQQFEI